MAGLLKVGGTDPEYVCIEDIVSVSIQSDGASAYIELRDRDATLHITGAAAIIRLQRWLDKSVDLDLHDCETHTLSMGAPCRHEDEEASKGD
jgi:hypothetical protein